MYTLVEPIPIDVERPSDIFFLWIGLWIILSIEIITFSFGFLKLNDWVPVVSDVKLDGVFKVVEKPETWKLFVSIFLTNIFDGSLLVPNKVGDKYTLSAGVDPPTLEPEIIIWSVDAYPVPPFTILTSEISLFASLVTLNIAPVPIPLEVDATLTYVVFTVPALVVETLDIVKCKLFVGVAPPI